MTRRLVKGSTHIKGSIWRHGMGPCAEKAGRRSVTGGGFSAASETAELGQAWGGPAGQATAVLPPGHCLRGALSSSCSPSPSTFHSVLCGEPYSGFRWGESLGPRAEPCGRHSIRAESVNWEPECDEVSGAERTG